MGDRDQSGRIGCLESQEMLAKGLVDGGLDRRDGVQSSIAQARRLRMFDMDGGYPFWIADFRAYLPLRQGPGCAGGRLALNRTAPHPPRRCAH